MAARSVCENDSVTLATLLSCFVEGGVSLLGTVQGVDSEWGLVEASLVLSSCGEVALEKMVSTNSR